VGQDRQPLAKERVDLRGAEPVTNALQRLGLLAADKPVVQLCEGDPAGAGLALRPVMAVETAASVSVRCS
jgi:hypothetical protein